MTTLEARLKLWLYDDSGAVAVDRPPVKPQPEPLPALTDEQCAGMDDMADWSISQ